MHRSASQGALGRPETHTRCGGNGVHTSRPGLLGPTASQPRDPDKDALGAPVPTSVSHPLQEAGAGGLLGTELYPQTWMSKPLTRTVAGNRVVVDDRGTRA